MSPWDLLPEKQLGQRVIGTQKMLPEIRRLMSFKKCHTQKTAFQVKEQSLVQGMKNREKETRKPSEILEWKNKKITFNMNSAKNYETPWIDMKGA